MTGDSNNPSGYYESATITDFHDRLLSDAGGHWSDWRPFDGSWTDSERGRRSVDELTQLVSWEYGDAGLFLVKDPRMCRLFPVWVEACDRLGIELRVVLPLRDPDEVALSLHTRDGFEVVRGQLIWLRHVLDAERHSRGLRRAVVRYDALLDDWRATVGGISREIGVEWPTSAEEAAAEIDPYLTRTLRHHVNASEAPATGPLGDLASTAYRALGGLVKDQQDSSATRDLDRVTGELDRVTALVEVLAGGDPASDARAEALEEAESARDQALALARALEAAESARDEALALAEAKERSLVDGLAERDRTHADALDELRGAHRAELERVAAEAGLRLRAEQARRRGLEQSLETRFAELATLSRRLLGGDGGWTAQDGLPAQDARSREPALLRELLATARLLDREHRHRERPGRWRWSRRRETDLGRRPEQVALKMLRRSHLFDAQWYLTAYPDVADSSMGPALHYLRYGAAEGRDPGPLFSTETYLERYPDVLESGANALVHYLAVGRATGRTFVSGSRKGRSPSNA